MSETRREKIETSPEIPISRPEIRISERAAAATVLGKAPDSQWFAEKPVKPDMGAPGPLALSATDAL